MKAKGGTIAAFQRQRGFFLVPILRLLPEKYPNNDFQVHEIVLQSMECSGEGAQQDNRVKVLSNLCNAKTGPPSFHRSQYDPGEEHVPASHLLQRLQKDLFSDVTATWCW